MTCNVEQSKLQYNNKLAIKMNNVYGEVKLLLDPRIFQDNLDKIPQDSHDYIQ